MAAAAVPALVSVEEYLHTRYEPDADYVDGIIEQRNSAEIDHSVLQRRLLLMLCSLSRSFEERVFPGVRVQVAPARFRVPDICVLAEGFQDTGIVKTPPVLCLEILSPEDRMSRVLRRARDFFAMGVPEIWIFDPEEKKAYRLLPGASLQEVADRLDHPAGDISLDLHRLFRSA